MGEAAIFALKMILFFSAVQIVIGIVLSLAKRGPGFLLIGFGLFSLLTVSMTNIAYCGISIRYAILGLVAVIGGLFFIVVGVHRTATDE